MSRDPKERSLPIAFLQEQSHQRGCKSACDTVIPFPPARLEEMQGRKRQPPFRQQSIQSFQAKLQALAGRASSPFKVKNFHSKLLYFLIFL